jgi:superfamily I DNA and/or RNA helicase
MSIISEFCSALESEIDALKEGRGGSTVIIKNGIFIKQTLEFYIYKFVLENFLIALDDTPSKIEINGQEYDCNIISVESQNVQLSINIKLADTIPLAKLKTNTWYLLDRLKKLYEEKVTQPNLFINSDRLFSGKFSKINNGNYKANYSENLNTHPNNSQLAAINSSLNNFISVIWGPPGTGKTITIAKAIESHLNLGRNVLLLSHSNNAVDQALEKVAKQTINTYYKDYSLLRFGIPKSDVLERFQSEIPFVLVEKIVEQKSKQLFTEKQKLTSDLDNIIALITFYQSIIHEINELKQIENKIKSNEDELNKTNNNIQNHKNEATQLFSKIEELTKKLNKANNSNLIKRIFLGLNPEKIQSEISFNEHRLNSLKENIENAKSNLSQLRIKQKELNQCKKDKSLAIHQKLEGVQISIQNISSELSNLTQQQKIIKSSLEEINRQIENIKSQIVAEAKLVATTLTKAYISKELENLSFDVLIVDEVSMAPMPMLYWAVTKSKLGVTIVGDFKQLPPICVSDDPVAKKWLGRSIFNELALDEISKCSPDKVSLLDTQYRMHPLISEIPRTLIYENRLHDAQSTKEKKISDPVSNDSTICLIDTSLHNPWCSQLDRGRFNLISALICVSIAEKILGNASRSDFTVGIVTPYKHQANLITKLAKDNGLLPSDKLRINNIHSFQGGEETTIIFDCVEGDGAKHWSFINEFNNKESAKLLLNVALTRAEKKIYLVANCSYLSKNFSNNTLLSNILKHFKKNGKIIPSTNIINDFKEEKFDYWMDKINSSGLPSTIEKGSYFEDEFWCAYPNDLLNAKDEVIIFSPFLTSNRVNKLSNIFKTLLGNGIKIFVITSPPKNNDSSFNYDSKKVIKYLKEIGVVVKFRNEMHEKIALIDKNIKWFGSLNILSHNNRTEYMERSVGENSAIELYNKFELDDLLFNYHLAGEKCPVKNCEGFVAIKLNKKTKKKFYSCSNFPSCKWSRNI